MEQFISEKSFPYKHFTTTKAADDMKDKDIRKSFLVSLKLNPAELVCADHKFTAVT